MPQTVIRPLEHADYPQVAALQNAHYLNHFDQTPQQMAQTDLEPSGIAQVMLALVQGFFLQSILLNQDAALEVYADTVRRLLSPNPR